MSGRGGSSTPTILPAASETDLAVKEAARREAERLRKRRGFQSTIVTGTGGVAGPAPGTGTILG